MSARGQRGLQPSPRNPTSRTGSTAAAAVSSGQLVQPPPLPGLKLCRPRAPGHSPLFASAVVHASRRRRLQSGCASAQLVLSAWCSTAWRTHRKSCCTSGVTTQLRSSTKASGVGMRRRQRRTRFRLGFAELFFARCKAVKLDAGELPSRAARPSRAASHVQCSSGSAAINTLAQHARSSGGRRKSSPRR